MNSNTFDKVFLNIALTSVDFIRFLSLLMFGASFIKTVTMVLATEVSFELYHFYKWGTTMILTGLIADYLWYHFHSQLLLVDNEYNLYNRKKNKYPKLALFLYSYIRYY